MTDTPISRKFPVNVPSEIGLHIDIVPNSSTVVDYTLLSELLSDYFGITNFTESNLIHGPTSLSFFTRVADLSILTEQLGKLFCSNEECSQQFKELVYADSFVLSYGSLPHNAKPWQQSTDVTIEAFWNDRRKVAEGLGIASTKLYQTDPSEKVEIGLLSVHPEYTDLGFTWGLTGFSRNLEDLSQEKLLFQYSTKHHPNRGTYSVEFERPTGLHPKHVISLENIFPPQEQCSLFAKYTFDKSLFLDKYQLAELSKPTPSRPPVGYLYNLWGESDLEAPVWAVDGYGSEALVQIYTKNRPSTEVPGKFQFELPAHSRYEVPQLNITSVQETQPWPAVFWACQPTKEELESHPSPGSVEAVTLGYEQIFPKSTVFHFLQPLPSDDQKLISHFDIPVAPVSAYETVQNITFLVIFGSFLYLIYELIGKARGIANQPKVKTK